MGNSRPVKTKDWIKFIEAHGCRYSRTKASHTHYKCPRCIRPIVFWTKPKDVPFIHLKTNLETMGKTGEYLYAWIEENC